MGEGADEIRITARLVFHVHSSACAAAVGQCAANDMMLWYMNLP